MSDNFVTWYLSNRHKQVVHFSRTPPSRQPVCRVASPTRALISRLVSACAEFPPWQPPSDGARAYAAPPGASWAEWICISGWQGAWRLSVLKGCERPKRKGKEGWTEEGEGMRENRGWQAEAAGGCGGREVASRGRERILMASAC